GRLFNMVGFQTKMTYPEQRRVFRMIPGLERAEFVRLGSLHRNTFVDSPALLLPSLQVVGRRRLLLAGQIVGVEGYVESAATGRAPRRRGWAPAPAGGAPPAARRRPPGPARGPRPRSPPPPRGGERGPSSR